MKRVDTLARLGMALIAFVLMTSHMEGLAHANPFLGKWRAVAETRGGARTMVPKAVVMIIEFAGGGKFRQTVKMGKKTSAPELGEWKILDGKLVVKAGVSKGRRTTRVFKYRRKGKSLLLSMKVDKETVVLQLRRAR